MIYNIVEYNEHDTKKIDEFTSNLQSMSEESVFYSVNTENGVRSSKIGLTGYFCKHQAWLHKNIKIKLPKAPPVTLNERPALGILALGVQKFQCQNFLVFEGKLY